jgi:CHAD domain-containing protein
VNPDFPAELARHLAESVRAARRRYRKRLARCQDKFSEKAVHELRIETRRILALLDLLEALRCAAPLKKLRKTFKKRLDAFDDLRDTHVQQVLLKPLWKDFPEARSLKKHLVKCEKHLVSELSCEINTIGSNRLNRDLRKIEKSLSHSGDIPARNRSKGLAQMVLGGAFRRVIILRRQIRRNKPATIHRTRVAFKRFRYTAELLQPFLPQFTPERLARMKDFQAVAGDIQDVAVLLARLDKDVKGGELPVTCIKKLRSELLRRERHAIDSFMSRLDELMGFEPENTATFTPESETSK